MTDTTAAVPLVDEPVPATLEDATWRGAAHEVAPGRVLLEVPGLARVLISADQVAVDRAPGADDRDVAWLVERPVGQVIALQAGEFALRASGVVIGGRAVALAGHGASGKSAAAAIMAGRGHAVLADHALRIEPGAPPAPAAALAGGGDLELWPDFAAQVDLDPEAGEIVRPALAKRIHRFEAGADAPLAVVIILRRDSDVGDPEVERLDAGEAITAVYDHTEAWPLIEPLGLRALHFGWMTKVAAGARVYRMRVDRHRRDAEHDAIVAAAVEELVAG